MIFPNKPTKTKGTFVKQYRKLVQPIARIIASLFVGSLGRPAKSRDQSFWEARGGPIRRQKNIFLWQKSIIQKMSTLDFAFLNIQGRASTKVDTGNRVSVLRLKPAQEMKSLKPQSRRTSRRSRSPRLLGKLPHPPALTIRPID